MTTIPAPVALSGAQLHALTANLDDLPGDAVIYIASPAAYDPALRESIEVFVDVETADGATRRFIVAADATVALDPTSR